MAKFALGIDVGTTTVKVALLDIRTKKAVATKNRQTHANIPSAQGSNGDEQDGDRILTAVQFCMSGLAKDDLSKVGMIGVSGQMHGVILWKKGEGWRKTGHGRFEKDAASQLFTWQDGRCAPSFLASLPTPHSHMRLATGMGCATLAWLQRNEPELLEKYDCAGTIQDFLVAMICGLEAPIMSVQNATSWGYFDCVTKSWNMELLQEDGFPVGLLPKVVDSGALIGCVQESWYNIPAGIPVGAALGDLQCSFLSRLPLPTDAVLNISTSAQLAFEMDESFTNPCEPPQSAITSHMEYFPYFNNRYLAVAASLTGGNALATFVKMLQQWTHELGLGVPKSKIWEKLQELASANGGDTDLVIDPTIFGERHAPMQRATVSNLTAQNLTLDSVYIALCKGVITNLHSMMTQEVLLESGITRINGSGTAVLKNHTIQHHIKKMYELPLELTNDCEADAAVGAALAVMNTVLASGDH